MKRVSVFDLTDDERAKFACILKDYIPELGIEDEEIDGGDCVEQICEIFHTLGPVTCEYDREAVGPADDENEVGGVSYWDSMRRRLTPLEDGGDSE